MLLHYKIVAVGNFCLEVWPFIWERVYLSCSSQNNYCIFFFCIVSLSPRHWKCVLFHLGSEFLNDFFKPINTEMDRLKSFKKHRHGRRIRQLEKFEQKMKEERQKRIQQRQKEFFGEIEVHKYVSFFLSSTFQLF